MKRGFTDWIFSRPVGWVAALAAALSATAVEAADVTVMRDEAGRQPVLVSGALLEAPASATTQTVRTGAAVAATAAVTFDSVTVLDRVASIFNISNAAAEFAVLNTTTDHRNRTHVRMRQIYRGLKVLGGELIVHFNADGSAYAVNGNYITNAAISITPTLTPDQAVVAAFAARTNAGEKLTLTLKDAPELVIVGRSDWVASPRLAYALALGSAFDGSNMPEYWKMGIDALTGEILFCYNDIKRATVETLPDGAPATITGKLLTREGGTVTNLTAWLSTNGTYYLENTNRHWIVGWYPDATGGESIADFADLDWYYMKSPTAEWSSTNSTSSHYSTSAQIEFGAAFNVDLVQRYYQEVHNRSSYDDAGSPAIVNVYYPYTDNAFWWGYGFNQFFIGVGDNSVASDMGALDVMGHELSHGVDDATANLTYSYDSGALNESFSDILAACIEFFGQPDGRAAYPECVEGHADWFIGEDVWLSNVALRDMRDPKNTLVARPQPSRYKGTNWYFGASDNGGVHNNSGVQNFFFYLLCEGGTGTNETVGYSFDGIGITNAEQIAYATLTAFCPADTDYSTVRSCWLAAARDCAETPEQTNQFVKAVNKAWNAVLGVLPPVIQQVPMANGRVGNFYNATVGCSTPYDYTMTLVRGTLPPGLTLTNSVFSGYPTTAGTYTFTVQASVGEWNLDSKEQTLTLTILPPFKAPYEEHFENASTLTSPYVSWMQEYLTNTCSWFTCVGNTVGHPWVASDGTNNAYLGCWRSDGLAVTNYVTRLISPKILFPADAYAAQVSFDLYMEKWDGNQDTLTVYYRTSENDAWTVLSNGTFTSNDSILWQHVTLVLPGTAANASYYVAFEANVNQSYGVCLDNIRIGDPTPALAITTASPITAYVKTNYPASSPLAVLAAEGGWDTNYTFTVVSNSLPSGFTLAADGTITGSSAVTESSTFAVEVKDSLGKVTTNVLSIVVEYPRLTILSENFDHVTQGALPAGWTAEVLEGDISFTWTLGTAGGRTGNDPPSAAYSVPDYAFFYGVPAVGESMVARLSSPVIDVSQMPGDRRLVFWHFMQERNGDQDELAVYWRATTNDTWHLLDTFTNNVSRWTKRSLAIPDASTTTLQFSFVGVAKSGYGVCVDSVSLTDESSAPVITTRSTLPSAFKTFSYSTTITAAGGIEPYTWSAVDLASLTSRGFSLTPSSDTTSVTLSGTPTVTNATPYVFQLIVTGADGLASTNSFSIKLLPAGSIPLYTSFDSGLPDGWSTAISKGMVNWKFAVGSTSDYSPRIPTNTATGKGLNACFWNSSIYSQINGDPQAVADLITTTLRLGNNSSNVVLSFQLCMAPYSPGDIDAKYCDKLVIYSRAAASDDWTYLTTITADNTYTNWTECRVSIPNPSNTFQLKFRGLSYGGHGICIDEMGIQGDMSDERSPYEKWVDAYFPSGNYPGDSSDQPAGDGVPNLMKYAMALDPSVSNVSVLIWGGLTDLVSNAAAPDGNYLYLRYRRSLSATDVVFRVVAKTNLTDTADVWSTNHVQELDSYPWSVGETDVWSWVYNIHLTPSTNAPMRFMRLEVYHTGNE